MGHWALGEKINWAQAQFLFFSYFFSSFLSFLAQAQFFFSVLFFSSFSPHGPAQFSFGLLFFFV
jgi:hypothetical protein